MSNIVSKIRQRIALREKNKFDLSCDHYTTGDFMQLSPVFIQELVPGESVNIKQQVFTRLAPMVKPMYGRARIELRKFFVPMRTIMRGWNEYITDTALDGQIPSIPTLNLHDLAVALNNSAFSTEVASTVEYYDYSSGTPAKKYRFTALGRQVWKILNSLGYRFPIGYWISQQSGTESTLTVSALPLLAFAKIYCDWYKNQAYNDATFFNLFDTLDVAWTVSKIVTLLSRIATVTYDKDELFVSAWDRPVAPNNGLVSSNQIQDITNDRTGNNAFGSMVSNNATATANSASTPAIKAVTASGAVDPQNGGRQITQYMIDSLKALTDYVKRHQIAGSQAMDRMMARFGMKPTDAALKRSLYLGKDTVDIQIADVMATGNGVDTDDQSSSLGDYAGKGVGFDSGACKFSTDEYGYIIFCASIIPTAHYVQGMRPEVMRGINGRLDFFTPEFDGIGVDALPRKMLLSDYNGGAESNLVTIGYDAAMDGVFGFVPRYANYKASFDNMTGDFVVPSLNGGDNMSVWHLNRMFDPSSVELADITHNLNFVSGTDAGQYDRIFAYQGDLSSNRFEHFYTIYHFNVESWKPMRKLFDDYDFDGGKDVTMEVNGTQLN